MDMFRQGDVLLRRVKGLPQGVEPERREGDGRIVLAHGEVTGHAHAIRAPQARTYSLGARRFLRTTTRALLRHEEHRTIELPPGVYEVVRQREYSPEEIRRVAD